MKDVAWEHTDRWISLPGKTARYFKSGAAITLRAPTARKVTIEFSASSSCRSPRPGTCTVAKSNTWTGASANLLSVLDGLGLPGKDGRRRRRRSRRRIGRIPQRGGRTSLRTYQVSSENLPPRPPDRLDSRQSAKRHAADGARHPSGHRPHISRIFSASRGFAGFPAATSSRFRRARPSRCSPKPTARNRTGTASPCSRRPGT